VLKIIPIYHFLKIRCILQAMEDSRQVVFLDSGNLLETEMTLYPNRYLMDFPSGEQNGQATKKNRLPYYRSNL
jgi:hypothetical protein